MHACMKWVCSFKAPVSDTSKSVHLSQKWERSITFKPWQSITYLGCWYVKSVVGWGSVARDNVQVEGVELIRCVNGCIASLGTGPAYAMKYN